MGFQNNMESYPLLNKRVDFPHESKEKSSSTILLLFVCLFIIAGTVYIDFCEDAVGKSLINFSLNSEIKISVSNEYPSIDSLKFYPWDYVVEPHRTTYLKVENPIESATYSWIISLDSEDPLTVDDSNPFEPFYGSEISFVFPEAGKFYNIQIEETGGSNRKFQTKVVCKYVRREIRDLTQNDKDIFLGALKVFHTISLEEGVEIHGNEFINHKELTRLHLLDATDSTGASCSPWHGGPVFITSHLAFIQWMERALQTINPSISIPYWDYIADAEEYGTDWSIQSPIFTQEFYGEYQQHPYDLSEDWNGLLLSTVETDEDLEARHNIFNVMTDVYNNDDTTTVRRSNEVCGWRFQEFGLPNCEAVALATTNISSLSAAQPFLEDGIHGNMHIMIGGAWDCGMDFSELMEHYKNNKQAQYLLEFLLAQVQVLYITGDIYNLYSDSENCTTSFEDCRFTCSDFNSNDDIDALSDELVYLFLENGTFFKHLRPVMYEDNTPGGFYKFVDVDDRVDRELKKYTMKLACNPGRMSAFSTPLAVTDDPLFASTHSYYQRYWSYLQLTNPNFEMDWSDSRECYAHSLDDQLPWSSFSLFGIGEKGENEIMYTNRDLLEIFDPSNPTLPYIHENFNWDYCSLSSS